MSQESPSLAPPPGTRSHRITARRRAGEQVSPLELFFDLVFVLAITQCSALMGRQDTWAPLAQGLLVLGVLWWSWVAYAWLTSVVDPESGLVRLTMFVAMAATLVMTLSVPQAFGDLALTFAIAYGVVRAAHIALYLIAAEDDPDLRRSVLGLAVGSAIGVSLLVGASFLDGFAQAALWLLALVLDVGEPYVFGAEGWKLEPRHFAERHGLVVIIALGESIVVLGIGTEIGLNGSVIAAAVVGLTVAVAMWWGYFDVGYIMSADRLAAAEVGRRQNELARDTYSYLHFPIVAGIVLFARGAEHVLTHLHEPLHAVSATALAGGVALFLGGLVAGKRRIIGTWTLQRLGVALLYVALIPVVAVLDAWIGLVLVAVILLALIAYETVHYAALRAEVRQATP
jgi:low temperature requirement protein LtrA